MAHVLESEEFKNLLSPGDGGPVSPTRREGPAPKRALTGLRHQQVFPDGHAGKEPDVLDCTHRAGPRDPIRTPMCNRLLSEIHVAAVGAVGTGDDVEERGLAGPVGSDHASTLSCATRRE